MASTTAQRMGHLPSGLGICTTLPDFLFLPELIFGGLVWILVASSRIEIPNPQGWVMFVSVFCFVVTFLWMMFFACGVHNNSAGWAGADLAYHGLAAFFYLSASVILAYLTIGLQTFNSVDTLSVFLFKTYQLHIAAVVFSFVATLLYFIHTILSAFRWKSF